MKCQRKYDFALRPIKHENRKKLIFCVRRTSEDEFCDAELKSVFSFEIRLCFIEKGPGY
jgi:hypothetical protein